MTHQFKVISDFQEIALTSNTLYVLDFDETVVYFDNINSGWWKKRFEHHSKTQDNTCKANKLVLKDWKNHISYNGPKHVDKQGFNSIVNHCVESGGSSHVIILTARDISLTDVTENHLNTISPNADINIIFCSGDNKGCKLQEYIDQRSKDKPVFDHIIFVDDRLYNLVDFKDVHVDSQCYHMIMPNF
jgi:hypothetical protein